MRLTTASNASVRPTSAFVSYSHRDEPVRKRLGTHLASARRLGKLSIWHDRRIRPGEEWARAIDENLRTADVVLLLISPDFVASDYCWGIEMTTALERHRRGEARVVPLFLAPVAGWERLPFAELQGLPTDAKWMAKYDDPERWLADVAAGLLGLLSEEALSVPTTPLRHEQWSATVDAEPAQFEGARRQELSAALRKELRAGHLDCTEARPGSTELRFVGTHQAYEAMERAHESGELALILGAPVLALSRPVGALVRLAVRDASLDSPSEHRLEIEPEPHWEPLLTGMDVFRNNPLQPGFHLAVDESAPAPDTVELTTRLGRYFNTFLVVTGEHLNVNLSPFEECCGVPPLLRGTDLGRDLLAQDLLLKEYTALLLHPDMDTGREFWSRVGDEATDAMEACLRVWITARKVTLREEPTDAGGRVHIQRLGLEVHSEEDYAALGASHLSSPTAKASEAAVDAFREFVQPRVEEEIQRGNRFSRLRQMHSAQILAEWLRERMGDALEGFAGSNDPERFGLVTCRPFESQMQDRYLRSFQEGVWRSSRTRFSNDETTSRLYVAGAISLGFSEGRVALTTQRTRLAHASCSAHRLRAQRGHKTQPFLISPRKKS